MKEETKKVVLPLLLGLIGSSLLVVASYFAINKVRNDGRIADDTKRIADVLNEKARNEFTMTMDCRVVAEEFALVDGGKRGSTTRRSMNCDERPAQ